MTGAITQSIWSSPTSLDWPFDTAEGAKDVYARFYDEAGNASGPVSHRIYFDRTNPQIQASGNTTIPIGWDRRIDATVDDASPVTVQIRYRSVNWGASQFKTFNMQQTGSTWTYVIPGQDTLANVEYHVAATDAAGNVTEKGPYAVGAEDITAPSVPTGVTTRTGDRSVTVTWIPSPEPDTAGYDVWRSDQPNGAYVWLDRTVEATYTDSGVLNGRTYYYKVSSLDVAGNPSAQNEPGVQAKLPQKLQSLAIELPSTAIVGQILRGNGHGDRRQQRAVH